jgi:hypothetical protein
MNIPTPYRATDRRVYQGSPCSDMRREFETGRKLMEVLKQIEPRAVSTYFPMEGFHLISIKIETEDRLYFEEITEHQDKQTAFERSN